MLESTNETSSFGPVYDSVSNGTSIDFEPSVTTPGYAAPMWNLDISPLAGGVNRVSWAIDKRNGLSAGTKLDNYSGAFIQTELSTNSPDVSANNVFLELWYRVNANETNTMTTADAANMSDYNAVANAGMLQSRQRLTVGMWLNAPGSTLSRNIEVNLSKTPNFDLCTTSNNVEGTSIPCEQAQRYGVFYADDVGLFDRRATGSPIVYFNSATLHEVFGKPQPTDVDSEGFSRVLIPVSALLRNAPG